MTPEGPLGPLPPGNPYVRVSLMDQDNFVRNMMTVLVGDTSTVVPVFPTGPVPSPGPVSAPKMTPPAGPADALFTPDELKMHLRIEPSQTEEDDWLLPQLEVAARLHTGNVLRRSLTPDTTGENVLQAVLLLIGHWYRNREAIDTDVRAVADLPLGYMAILSCERDYPPGIY